MPLTSPSFLYPYVSLAYLLTIYANDVPAVPSDLVGACPFESHFTLSWSHLFVTFAFVYSLTESKTSGTVVRAVFTSSC
jgi:hypothetical protein